MNRHRSLFIFIFIFFAILHLIIPIVNHYYFRTFTYDYGGYNFAFYDFAHFRVSIATNFSAYNLTFLQDHFSLTLIILSPIYWLTYGITGSYTVLLLQWVFIVFGSYCTYKYILVKAENKNMALFGLVFYNIIYNRFSTYQSDCNLAVFGAAMLPAFLYYFETKKLIPTILSFLFILFNREDFPLTLLFICIYLVIEHRKDKAQFRLAWILLISSIVGFEFIFKIIIPFLEDENRKYSNFNYSILGENPAEALKFIVSNPIKSLSYLFINHTNEPALDFRKASFYLVYGLSGGILLFLKPKYLICFIPLVAKKMFNDDSTRWGFDMYYSVEIVSILPIFIFSTIAQFKGKILQEIAGILVCLFSTGISYYCIETSTNGGFGNIKYHFYSKDFYKSDLPVNEIYHTFNFIPDSASVCATGDILPHLALRKEIYYYPATHNSDYIFVNTTANTYPVSRGEFDQKTNELLRSEIWKLKWAWKNFYVFKRKVLPDI